MNSSNKSLWLKNPWWDLICLAFAWVPFYAWIVWGLGLGGELPHSPAGWASLRQNVILAVLTALGCSYVHRHYTLLLVYGDQQTLSRNLNAYIIAPLIVFSGLAAAYFSGVKVAWTATIVIAVVWNVWHTIMQRHGIFRAYAGRARGGLENRTHGRLDLALIWSLLASLVCLVAIFRQSTFSRLLEARMLMKIIRWFEQTPLIWIVPSIVAIITLIVAVQWCRYEYRAELSWPERIPRLLFLGSTLCLLALFIIHGPLVGYLCFGVAHALEYIFFVHRYGEGKYAQDRSRGVAASLFRSPLKTAPFLIGGLVIAYYVLLNYNRTAIYLIYYSGTSLLHFLYDGWIWKIRKPEVAQPLGITTS